MKIYHLFAGNLRHITPQLLKTCILTEKRISDDPSIEHVYCIKMYGGRMLYDNAKSNPYPAVFKEMDCPNFMYFFSHKELVKYLLKVSPNDKVLLHGFPTAREFVLASSALYILNPKLLKRSSVVCWGSDYKVKSTSLVKRLFNQYMKFILGKFKFIIALSTEDETEIKYFVPNGNVVYAPYVVREKLHLAEKMPDVNKSGKTIVMVSHSGWPHNNHIHSFELLKKYVGRIKIVCPLCYGDAKYIQSVIDTGTSMFGQDFSYFIDLMPSEEYKEFLKTIDVYVTSAEIQTGLGAVYLNMRWGNKIFVKGNIYKSLSEHQYNISNTDQIKNLCFDEFALPLSKAQALDNIAIYNELHFDGTEIVNKWRRVYEY